MIIGLEMNRLTLYTLEFTISFLVFWGIYMLSLKIRNEKVEIMSNKKIVNMGRKRIAKNNENISNEKVNNFKTDGKTLNNDLKKNDTPTIQKKLSENNTKNAYKHLTNQVNTQTKNHFVTNDRCYSEDHEKDISEMLGEKLDHHFDTLEDIDENSINITKRRGSPKREKSFDINNLPDKKLVRSQIIELEDYIPDFVPTTVKNKFKDFVYTKKKHCGLIVAETTKVKERKISIERLRNYTAQYKKDGFYLERVQNQRKNNLGVIPIRGLDAQNHTNKGTQNPPQKTRIQKLVYKKEICEYNIIHDNKAYIGGDNTHLITTYPTAQVHKNEDFRMDEEILMGYN